MNSRARADLVQQGKVSLKNRLRNNIIARADVVGKVAQPVAPLANAVLSFPPARLAAEKMFGIARHAPFPKFCGERFSAWFHNRPRRATRLAPTTRKVVYFHGCSSQ